MSETSTQSKILTLDEQIKALKEKKKREIAKLERNVGKKFIEMFDCQNMHIDAIYEIIEEANIYYKENKLKNEYHFENNEVK
ncbi:hypothetical protein [Heyndrickxia camelliae]|uniref:Uncharacterized protein n=1 Tax=Heyndrickxia camelliae TaxID=1707093 RepID=A0A2N3LEV0_9BACI|nr:hypothetical protein [Heyndrickxia camelliae]PKR83074.1 hypothetical protein CWO92_21290 [Heyndrickxia camelliae]